MSPLSPSSSHRRAAAVVTGALLVSLTGAVTLAQPAAAAAPLKGAGTCADIDVVYQPKSAFPATRQGLAAFLRQQLAIEPAVLCLINAERAAIGRQPLKRYLTLGKKGAPTLGSAAARHAADSVKLRWWGKVTPGKDCRPMKDAPGQCDPHVNPQTGSTPLSRAQAVGYGRRCSSYAVAENAYAGWGGSQVTPRAAVTWWMNSRPHREAILDPAFTEAYTKAALGSADPAAGSVTPAVTYVQMFGRCG
ncbi:CAP domain-containing protein [Nonomuraea sp. NPDC050643]|uniref:CAP domain-containing protein n=1 Tax=Nonomuraea sp. NPDC050643 TaxID=3155660 RepID=UPI0033D94352